MSAEALARAKGKIPEAAAIMAQEELRRKIESEQEKIVRAAKCQPRRARARSPTHTPLGTAATRGTAHGEQGC